MDIQSIVSSIASSPALEAAAAKVGVTPEQAQAMLHGVLTHVDNGGAAETAAAPVAVKTGIDPELVQRFLPMIAPLLVRHAQNVPAGAEGGLGGLLGALGGLEGGGGAGGLAGLAEGLFGQG